MSWLALTVAALLLQEPPSFEPATPESEGLRQSDLEELAAVVQSYVDADEVVGAELWILRHDRTVLHRAFGWKDREEQVPMEPGGVFCLRSMTKAVVGTAVQMLIDEGQLAPEDPVSKHLPCFDNERSRAITVEQLLAHTSGLPLSSLLGQDLARLDGERAVAELAGASGPEFPPGEGFHYSDDNADVLGALVEVLSGQELAAFLEQRIFVPLGMDETAAVMTPDHPLRARACSNYVGGPGAWERYWSPRDPPLFPFLLGSQGLYGSARDYARFLHLWKAEGYAGGEALLSPRALRHALEPLSPMPMPSAFDGVEARYGRMMQVWARPLESGGEELVAFGHGGSDGTMAWVFPELDLVVLYFTQSRNGTTLFQLGEPLQRLVLDPLLGTERALPLAYADEELDEYQGLYWEEDEQKYQAVLRRGSSLLIEFPGRALLELAPTPQRDVFRLQVSAQHGFEFERSETGAVAAFTGVVRGERERLPRWRPAPGLASVDEVLAEKRAASDWDSIEPLGAVRIGTRLALPGLGLTGSGEALVLGLDHLRSEEDYGATREGALLAGDRGWSWSSSSEPEELTGGNLARLRSDHPFLAIADWRALYRRIEVLAEVDREGTRAWLVRAEPAQGNAHTWTVARASGLPLALASVDTVPGLGEVGRVTTFGDWRAVGGVRLPFRQEITYATRSLGRIDVLWESVEAGLELPDDTFRPPSAEDR